MVRDKPDGYAFLSELADSTAQQISIEAAQPNLDVGILANLSNKQIVLGVLDLSTPTVETAEQITQRICEGLQFVPIEHLVAAPDC
jgi:5-methyltetrahydropteroyltriglutamate--homocysteine methyltransferase